MSFYAPHISLAAVLKDKVANLENYAPDLFLVFEEFICIPDSAALVGGYKYVKQIMESLVGPNKKPIDVQLYNTPTPPGNYALFVEFLGSSGEEQFLGEHAGYSYTPNVTKKIFTSFTPRNLLASCPKTLILNPAEINECALWPLQEAAVSTSADCEETFILKSVILLNGLLNLEFDRAIDKSLLGRSWVTRAPSFGTVNAYSGTIDDVRLRVILRTVGEIEIHLLMAMLTRWLIKLARTDLRFTADNLQASRVTQGAPSLESESPDVFVTAFDFSCRSGDTWISNRTPTSSHMGLAVGAESTDESETILYV